MHLVSAPCKNLNTPGGILILVRDKLVLSYFQRFEHSRSRLCSTHAQKSLSLAPGLWQYLSLLIRTALFPAEAVDKFLSCFSWRIQSRKIGLAGVGMRSVPMNRIRALMIRHATPRDADLPP